MAGYHLGTIRKGEFGEISKIVEEVDELVDADLQKNRIMVLLELSDLVGAIEGYLSKHTLLTLGDLITMSHATARAFESGER